MTTFALDVSAAHPLYLYVVFAVCVIAALALLIGATVSRRNSSWRRQMQLQQTAIARRAEPAYPIEPAAATPDEAPEAELVTATATDKKTTPGKTAAKKTTAKKTTAAKKATPAKKTASRTRQ